MARRSKAEYEHRVTQVYAMLLRREPRHVILQFASSEWEVSKRMADEYIAAATAYLVQEQEELRSRAGKMFFYETMASLDYVFRQAVRDRDWRTCLAVIKEQNSIMGVYPTKMPTVEAIKVLVEDNVVPTEVLQEISTELDEFQHRAIAAFKKVRQSDIDTSTES